jgi:hypothetical protein
MDEHLSSSVDGGRCFGDRRLPLQVSGDFGELGEGGLEVFDDLKLRSPPALSRSYPRHFTFYVAHPLAPFSGDDVGVERWPRVFSGCQLYGGRHRHFEYA